MPIVTQFTKQIYKNKNKNKDKDKTYGFFFLAQQDKIAFAILSCYAR